MNKTGAFDLVNGWAMKERNWAVITAAQARVDDAEARTPAPLSLSEIESPTSKANAAELAWHFFLPSLTSGYMYYGSSQDMPIKQSVACNIAVKYANKVIPTSQSSCVKR